ncbi:hypothetical protein cypCar_00016754 [Cyprinus carpio]|nr:hypothetical protein cypCar_00016754 [Cyprinus carpio]
MPFHDLGDPEATSANGASHTTEDNYACLKELERINKEIKAAKTDFLSSSSVDSKLRSTDKVDTEHNLKNNRTGKKFQLLSSHFDDSDNEDNLGSERIKCNQDVKMLPTFAPAALAGSNNESIVVDSISDEELRYSDLDLSESDPMEEFYRIFMEANQTEGPVVQCNAPEHVLSEDMLRVNNFSFKHKDKADFAFQYGDTKKGISDPLKRICCRCGATFSVDKSGKHTRRQECNYHFGKVIENRVSLQGIVNGLPQSSVAKTCPGVCGFDTQTCYTTQGLELARVTVVNSSLQVVIDSFVKPDNDVVEYNTWMDFELSCPHYNAIRSIKTEQSAVW